MRDGKDVGVLEKKDLNEKNLIGLMTGRAKRGEEKVNLHLYKLKLIKS